MEVAGVVREVASGSGGARVWLVDDFPRLRHGVDGVRSYCAIVCELHEP